MDTLEPVPQKSVWKHHTLTFDDFVSGACKKQTTIHLNSHLHPVGGSWRTRREPWFSQGDPDREGNQQPSAQIIIFSDDVNSRSQCCSPLLYKNSPVAQQTQSPIMLQAWPHAAGSAIIPALVESNGQCDQTCLLAFYRKSDLLHYKVVAWQSCPSNSKDSTRHTRGPLLLLSCTPTSILVFVHCHG